MLKRMPPRQRCEYAGGTEFHILYYAPLGGIREIFDLVLTFFWSLLSFNEVGLTQRLFQVFGQIIDMFDAHG
jgi:hypothetical protein